MTEKRTRYFMWFFAAVTGAGAACVFFGSAALLNIDTAPVHPPYLRPGFRYPLGTDSSGRDVLMLLIRSSGTSLIIGLGSALFATFIGALVGCLAGYRRSLADDLLMRLTDIFLLVPTLPLLIVLTAYLGPGVSHVALVIALTGWPATARVVRAQVLKLREQPFVLHSRHMGAGSLYLIRRHILPNCTELLLAKSALSVAAAMLAEAGNSFLGLGDPAHPSWGSMLHDAFAGAALINGCWWWYMPPVLCISISVTLFNLAGQALSDRDRRTGTQTAPPTVDVPAPALPPANALAPAPSCLVQPGERGLTPTLLTVRNLTVSFQNHAVRQGRPAGEVRPVVNGLDLDVHAGEKIAIVGATGSGKSLLLLAILGLLPHDTCVRGGIWIDGRNLTLLSLDELRHYRGVTAAYVPQGAGNALNPVIPVGRQVAERARVHYGLERRQALRETIALFRELGLPEPERGVLDYPHHLSGGMKQRVLLAAALAGGHPPLLLADETTKGLDPAAVREVIGVFKGLKEEAVLAVTHDLAFAEALGGKVMVMYEGVVVEEAPAGSFFEEPMHPYCRALVAAQPSQGMHVDDVAWNGNDNEGAGCIYRRQCPVAGSRCIDTPPLLPCRGHRVRCWRYAA